MRPDFPMIFSRAKVEKGEGEGKAFGVFAMKLNLASGCELQMASAYSSIYIFLSHRNDRGSYKAREHRKTLVFPPAGISFSLDSLRELPWKTTLLYSPFIISLAWNTQNELRHRFNDSYPLSICSLTLTTPIYSRTIHCSLCHRLSS